MASRKRFPKEGKILQTTLGAEKVVAVDIFRERVYLRGEGQASRIIPLSQLRDEQEQAALRDGATGEVQFPDRRKADRRSTDVASDPPETSSTDNPDGPLPVDASSSPTPRRRRRRRRRRGSGGHGDDGSGDAS